jgi:hypothetical protein
VCGLIRRRLNRGGVPQRSTVTLATSKQAQRQPCA